MCKKTVVWLVSVLCLGGAGLRAQDPPQADSLRREVQRLTARIDSLERVVRQLAGEKRDTTAARDELAALRAAAAAAGGGDRADTAAAQVPQEQTQFVDRSRNLNQLNPELSVTGDVRLQADPSGVFGDNIEVREFEVSFQSALDPYSSTKIFAAFEDGEVNIEEAYAYWSGLPGRLRVDLGRLRQQLGELNRWHLHALPETDYPLVLRRYFGDEGLIGDGLGLYWMIPAGGGAWGVHELWTQATFRNFNEILDDGNRVALLGHLNNFWQLTPATYLQIGATGLHGTHPDSSLKARLGGLDVRWTWRPPARALYREWTLRGELYAVQRKRAGAGETRYGGYVGTAHKFDRRWSAGVRYDYVEAAEGPLVVTRQLVPTLTFLQSEFMRLRLQYRYARSTITSPTHELSLQALWAIGPHRDEIF